MPAVTQEPVAPSLMTNNYNLQRFIDAQQDSYEKALIEIKNGRKQTHWMWYIFPQIKGLGYSETSKYYAIENLEEATQYLQHNPLGNRLIDISTALLDIKGKMAYQIFGSPDDSKLKSCMTLFNEVKNTNEVFGMVLSNYFEGKKHSKTLRLIKA